MKIEIIILAILLVVIVVLAISALNLKNKNRVLTKELDEIKNDLKSSNESVENLKYSLEKAIKFLDKNIDESKIHQKKKIALQIRNAKLKLENDRLKRSS